MLFNPKKVDENEHLLPKPYGALCSLNLDHFHRYVFARYFAYDKVVLDAAMGCGYASLILPAKRYVGVDIDDNMVAFARQHYAPIVPHASYEVGSVTELPVDNKSADLYISYETVEHIDEAAVEAYFAEAVRVLKRGGTFICSTPIFRGDKLGLITRYHRFEFGYGELEKSLVKHGLALQEIWFQHPPRYMVSQRYPTFEETRQRDPYISIVVATRP